MKQTSRPGRASVLLAAALGVLLAAEMASAGLYDNQASIQFSGYNKSETLTNFPVLVLLSNNCFSGFSYSQFKSGSNDLAFTADAAGKTNLNYEIDTWNPSGASYVWVQVPALTGSTAITAWWGAAGQSQPVCTTNGSTWSNGFVGVWHMNEFPPKDSAKSLHDHSCYNASGATAGVVTNVSKIGSGVNYASSGLTSISNNTDLAGSLTTNYTFSMWYFKRSQGGGNNGSVMGGGDYNWGLRQQADALSLRLNGTYYANTGPLLPNANWFYVGYTYHPGTCQAISNGVLVNTTSTSASWQAPLYLVGIGNDNTRAPDGILDEMRFSSVVRSTNWVWAEYMNAASNGVFNNYGAAVLANPNLPKISNVGSQNLLSTTADVVGTLITNGAAGTATAYLYWSTTDGTNNASTWTAGGGSMSNLGSFADGTTFTNTLTGLAQNTTYYWNYSAFNASGTVWGAIAGSPSFKTLAAPAVTNSMATSVGEFSATLNGNLTGGGSAHIYILQGLQDGVWSVTNDVGPRTEGAFSFPVSGLALATKYYYTAYATNVYGSALAVPSTSFTTLSASTYTFNVNNGNWTVAGNWTGGSYAPPRNGDSGIILTNAYANGNLYNVGVETPPAQIWVRTNASLQVANGVGLAEHNLILDGGTLGEKDNGGTATNNGTLRVNRNSTIGVNNNDSIKLNGLIQDNGANSGLLQIGQCGGSSSTIWLNGTNNTWTGGATVGGGSGGVAPIVYAGAPGCFGTGTILVTNGLLVTAWQAPSGANSAAQTTNINVVAVTNVFGSCTVTVCGASARYSGRVNSGQLDVMGDSPNATYLLNSGGILGMHTNLVGGTLILNGGSVGLTDFSGGNNNLYDYWNVNPTFYGPIRVRSNSYLGSGSQEVLAFSSPIQNDGGNTGTLITQPPSYYQQTIKLYTTNSSWTGGFLAQGQAVNAAASNCLGTGAVVINNPSTYHIPYGTMAGREYFQLSVPYAGANVSSFTVAPNGYVIIGNSNVVGNVPIVLASGATAKYLTGSFSGNTLVSDNGIVSVPDNSANQTTLDTILVNTSVTFIVSYSASDSLTLNGYIRDGTTAGQVIKGVGGDTLGRDWVKLGCPTNSYSGGTDVQRGPLEILAAGALSTGNVTINSGGRLKTSAANSLGSVTGTGHSVSVNANGTLELNSTETASYTLQTGGALVVDAPGTAATFTYGTGGNIQLAKGAILDISVTTRPSRAIVLSQLLSGDGRFGLYEGRNGTYGNGTIANYTATRFFGDDSNTNIWRGLALLNCGSTMTCATNTMAANAGTAYLDFYAQQDATFTFQSASLLANSVLLNGNGTFVFQNGCGTSTYNNVYFQGGTPGEGGANSVYFNGGSTGIGGLKIVSNGDVRAGATVSISNGWFTVSCTDTLANLTVNLGSGAVFNITTNLTAGTINLNSGSGTYEPGLPGMSAGANWIVYAGSQIGVGVGRNGGTVPIYDLPANGLADFVGWGDYYNGNNNNSLPLYLNKGLVLGNNTRYTPGPYNDTFYIVHNLTVQDSDGGNDAFRLAAGSTQCRLCSPGGTTNTIGLPVTLNAGAGKLIVGDTNLFNALIVGGLSGFLPITQNGTVYLTNQLSQIGDVDIQAGTLEVNALAVLGTSAAAGGSRTIATSNAATMWLNFANPGLSNTTLRGSGTLVLSTPTDTLTLTNAAGANGAIQPGMAGPLSVQGNLTLAASATPTPFTVNIGKTGSVVTNTMLAVAGNVTGLTNASLYVTFDPKMNGSDVAGKVFTILTCANNLSATQFKSVTWASPAKGGTVVYANGAVQLTTVSIPASGTTIFVR